MAGTFPVLKPKQIIQYLKDLLEQDVDESLLKEPIEQAKIREIYQQVLSKVLAVKIEEIDGLRLRAMGVFSHPKLHSKAIEEIDFFRQFQSLLETAGIEDFSIKDIQAPSSQRVQRILSGIINWVIFTEDRVEQYSTRAEEADVLEVELESNTREVEDLEAQLRFVNMEIEQEKEEQSGLYRQIDAKRNEIHEMNTKQAMVHASNEKKRKYLIKINEDNETLEQELTSQQTQADHLQKQIVRSPERVRNQLKDLPQFLEQERKSLIEGTRKITGIEAKLKALAKIEGEFHIYLSLLHEGEQVAANLSEGKQNLKNTRQEISQTEQVLRECNTKKQHLTSLVQKNKNSQELASLSRRTQELQQKSDSARAELHELVQAENHSQTMISKNSQAEQQIRVAHQTLQRKYDQDTAILRHVEDQLQRDLLLYLERLREIKG